jgi:hypothetical protein
VVFRVEIDSLPNRGRCNSAWETFNLFNHFNPTPASVDQLDLSHLRDDWRRRSGITTRVIQVERSSISNVCNDRALAVCGPFPHHRDPRSVQQLSSAESVEPLSPAATGLVEQSATIAAGTQQLPHSVFLQSYRSVFTFARSPQGLPTTISSPGVAFFSKARVFINAFRRAPLRARSPWPLLDLHQSNPVFSATELFSNCPILSIAIDMLLGKLTFGIVP